MEAEHESDRTITGSWHARNDSLSIKYSIKKPKSPAEKKELNYQLKLVPKAELAAKYVLLIQDRPLVFTHDEELILDTHLPAVTDELKAKCLKLLNQVAEASLATDQNIFASDEASSGKFKVQDDAVIGAIYVKNGLTVEASIGLISDKGWDCLYRSRFSVNLKNKTCGLTSFTLDHCAQ